MLIATEADVRQTLIITTLIYYAALDLMIVEHSRWVRFVEKCGKHHKIGCIEKNKKMFISGIGEIVQG